MSPGSFPQNGILPKKSNPLPTKISIIPKRINIFAKVGYIYIL